MILSTILVMAVIIFIVLLPILFYVLAHKMRNAKWLVAYSLFWLVVLGFIIYDLNVISNLPDGNDDLSLGWVLVAAPIYSSCFCATVGIIGRSIVLYLTRKGRIIKKSNVHLISLCTIFAAPQLIMPIAGLAILFYRFFTLTIDMGNVIQIFNAVLKAIRNLF